MSDNGFYSSRVLNDPLAVIYNQGQWRLSKVSALHNLQYNVLKLKQYSTKIKQTIANMVTSNASIKYSVKVEGNSDIKYSEDDSDALVIEVSSKESKDNNPKVVYEAILLSWGTFDSVPNAVHLPYMIERGEQRVGAAVKNAMSTIFDSNIKQFHFSQNHLLHFGLSLIETETANSTKHIGFTYSTPQAEHKDKLTINFEIGDVYMIWNGMKEETNQATKLVNRTYQALQNQIFYMFEFDITALELHEVTLPKAFIKNNGTVKMKTPEMVNGVLTVLNGISDR